MKYQKKPVVVEAFQMKKQYREGENWPWWLLEAWKMNPGAVGAVWSGRDCLFVGTLGGAVEVEYGDWIICGVGGELYPCKPDIFEKTYERVGDTEIQEYDKELRALMNAHASEAYDCFREGMICAIRKFNEVSMRPEIDSSRRLND